MNEVDAATATYRTGRSHRQARRSSITWSPIRRPRTGGDAIAQARAADRPAALVLRCARQAWVERSRLAQSRSEGPIGRGCPDRSPPRSARRAAGGPAHSGGRPTRSWAKWSGPTRSRHRRSAEPQYHAELAFQQATLDVNLGKLSRGAAVYRHTCKIASPGGGQAKRQQLPTSSPNSVTPTRRNGWWSLHCTSGCRTAPDGGVASTPPGHDPDRPAHPGLEEVRRGRSTP